MTIEIRAARPADTDQLVALNAARNGAWTGSWVRVLMEDAAGRACWRVAVHGDRVAAGVALLPASWTLEGIDLGGRQVEFVATDPGFERRGLVRRLLADLHRDAAAEGALVQLVTGIPFFYRQFGYEYAVADLDRRLLATVPAPPEGWTVRAATRADVPVLDALDAAERARCGAPLVGGRHPDQWRWLFASPGFESLLALDPAGRVRASTRLFTAAGEIAALEPAATDPDGTRALLAHVAARPADRRVLAGRPGTTAGAVIAEHTVPDPTVNPYPVAVRVGDPVALLDRIRPVLDRRLAAAGLGGLTTTLTITAYRWTVQLTIRSGRVAVSGPGPGRQDPSAPDTVGVPPDLMATLLLGAEPASALEGRHPDVVLGPHRELADALFPGVALDARAY